MNAEITYALLDVFRLIVPEMVLGLGACVLFLGSTFQSDRRTWGVTALLALALAAVAWWYTPLPGGLELLNRRGLPYLWQQLGRAELFPDATRFAGPLLLDRVVLLTKLIALVGGLVLVLLSWDEVPDRWAGEYHGCVLLITAGTCLTAASNELVMLFLALELVSIPTYVLLYLPRTDPPAQEAALKYFLLSIFSSALVLFGFSYLYGLTGTTNLPAIMEAIQPVAGTRLPGLAQVALIMVVAGLGFRLTAVPFHFYAPDVYQGTTTPNAALLALVPKVVGFVALMRLLGFALGGTAITGLAAAGQVPSLLWILAAVTMTLGNLLALLQDNLKRLLAYSSVAHAGYMLMGLAAAPLLPSESVGGGTAAVLFYLVAYGAMTVGAFAVLTLLDTPDKPLETVDDLAGLSRTHPVIALVMALLLFSLIGIPLTAGFAGKLLLFWGVLAVPADSAQAALFRTLAVIAALNAAVGAWYYLRIVAVMYLRPAVRPLTAKPGWPLRAALAACAAVTLGFGVVPRSLEKATQEAVADVLAPGAQALLRP